MAVFTRLARADVDRWLGDFEIGRLERLDGIGEGIENTNYFVTTAGTPRSGDFVLTLFERLDATQLPFYLEFMRAAADDGVEVPRPIASRDGAILHSLAGKPCCLATRLPGRFLERPTAAHCAELGIGIARLHAAGARYARERPELMQPNLRGLDWWRATAPQILPRLDARLAALLEDELQHQVSVYAGRELPRGPVHADIFRNNVLFDGSDALPRLGGFIDFYFAGVDDWLFDLAVAVNDWCVDLDSGALDDARADALLRAYDARRAFTRGEHAAWNDLLRAAAFRFWLSRLWDVLQPRHAHALTPHDPTHFERVLGQRRAHSHALPS